jgi:hypothetical protein
MLRGDEILLKAQELAEKAEISKKYFPKSTAVAIAIDAAKWADKTIIDKACDLLYEYNKQQAKKHGSRKELGISDFTINVYDFRKALEYGK